MEQFPGAASAEAVCAQAVYRDAHGSERLRDEREEDAAGHALLEVSGRRQAGVLPLPVEGEAMHWETGRVERRGQGPDIVGPRGELWLATADLPDCQRRPKPRGERLEDGSGEGGEAAQAQPHARKQCVRARTRGLGVRKHSRLAAEVGVGLRAEDGQMDEAGVNGSVSELPLDLIVEAQRCAFEQGRVADGLRQGPLPH